VAESVVISMTQKTVPFLKSVGKYGLDKGSKATNFDQGQYNTADWDFIIVLA
jgi:hypothetical protein